MSSTIVHATIETPAGARVGMRTGNTYRWMWWNVLEQRWTEGCYMSAAEIACLPQIERDAIVVHGHEVVTASGHVLHDLAA